MIKVSHIYKSYITKYNQTDVLKDMSFSVESLIGLIIFASFLVACSRALDLENKLVSIEIENYFNGSLTLEGITELFTSLD
jgi:hypothetical protein